ncbi:upstream-binding factor 1-like protein 1 [Ochotona curzoniae]|uniref:upstream-binding factor 1-like protein 1 n=1 Tax=Ochotona curzoniae TaxID=130825 RepID=UPI001B348A1F|nr:upstream-binding factor 1-like protein 1 [Ochotona curzoniae]
MKHAKEKTYKGHPDFPKKPLTPYIRFYKENWPEYSQKFSKMSNPELTKVLSEKYKQLPEHEKQRYKEEFQREKLEFEEKLAQFYKDHPDLVQDAGKSALLKTRQARASNNIQRNQREMRSPPKCVGVYKKIIFLGEPKKPPMNAYHKFHQDLLSSGELRGLPHRERMVEISRRWQRIPQRQREHFSRQAEELQKQYKVNLDLWLQSLSPEEYALYKEISCGKGRNMRMTGGPDPNAKEATVQHSAAAKCLQEAPGEKQRMQISGPSEHLEIISHTSQGAGVDMREDVEDTDSDSSNSSSEDKDEHQDADTEDSSSSSSSSDSI